MADNNDTFSFMDMDPTSCDSDSSSEHSVATAWTKLPSVEESANVLADTTVVAAMNAAVATVAASVDGDATAGSLDEPMHCPPPPPPPLPAWQCVTPPPLSAVGTRPIITRGSDGSVVDMVVEWPVPLPDALSDTCDEEPDEPDEPWPPTGPVEIITHSGRFHNDEVMAIAILQDYLQAYGSRSYVTRTRDGHALAAGVVDDRVFVVDVGKTYDSENKCYDHHQISFNDTMPGFEKYAVPLSSCGLVYRHYGRDAIEIIAGELGIRDYNLDWVYRTVYRKLILPIDANDNGVPYAKDQDALKYTPFTLDQIIGAMNQQDVNSEEQEYYFHEACVLCADIFNDCVMNALRSSEKFTLEEPRFVACIGANKPEHTRAGLLVLADTMDVRPLLNKYDFDQAVWKLVVCPNSRGTWNLWTIPKRGERFTQLVKYIPESEAKAEHDDVVFIHKVGFCGEVKSYETAVAVALESISQATDEDEDEPAEEVGLLGWLLSWFKTPL